ncbi:LysR family transcriptional regulator [Achromobacter sp. Marseille-Q0513]|uniref:LysR substrate-binding domain-containing protein n=1 Tax=Achromobacter sp. Marseille-Q0513 TaxID=2829161 RepID=UPI001B9C1B30|nr:LysR substrate-binding domain-containing protein [Achromobacter sp. Marseille-Q0513]MBR8653504.1 LysR family transcriptional regulator [Achromobacter sp. Marseille-Q0513]
MRLPLPSMPELHAFLAVAQAGSFSAAAQTLFVTQGGVSRCVQRLESRLGMPLFLRNGRGVSLTPTGQRLYEQIEPAMRTLADAVASVQAHASPRGVLRLRTVSTLSMRWLVPRLPQFHARMPGVRVIIQPNVLDDDFLEKDVDCWLYWRKSATGQWPRHLRSTYIIGREIVPVCHPSVLPGIQSPADLLRHPLLYHVEAPELWQQWCEAYGQPAPKMLDSEFNIMAAAIDAVANNFGVVLSPRCLVQMDEQAGRVAVPAGMSISSRRGYFLCTPKTRDGDPLIDAFRSWLLECAATDFEQD